MKTTTYLDLPAGARVRVKPATSLRFEDLIVATLADDLGCVKAPTTLRGGPQRFLPGSVVQKPNARLFSSVVAFNSHNSTWEDVSHKILGQVASGVIGEWTDADQENVQQIAEAARAERDAKMAEQERHWDGQARARRRNR